jgi:hypothetical protein
MFRRHSYSGFSETMSGEENGTYLFCAIPLVHGNRHLRLSAFHFSGVYPTDTCPLVLATYNTCIPVDLDFMSQVDISERNHSKVYPGLSIQDIAEKSGAFTGRYACSGVIRDVCESPASHCEALIAREHHASLSGLGGADETNPRSSRQIQLTRPIEDHL